MDDDFRDGCVFVVLFVVLFVGVMGVVCGGLDLVEGGSFDHAAAMAMECAGFYGLAAIITAATN